MPMDFKALGDKLMLMQAELRGEKPPDVVERMTQEAQRIKGKELKAEEQLKELTEGDSNG